MKTLLWKLFLPKGWYWATFSDGNILQLFWTGWRWETRLGEFLTPPMKVKRIC